MGVVTPAGVVGRVVKRTRLRRWYLVTDPNNAIAGVVQRTRDEGIVEGTSHGSARLKYVAVSRVQAGDRVVTSGLTESFHEDLARKPDPGRKIGRRSLQSAEIEPEVDLSKLDEVFMRRRSL